MQSERRNSPRFPIEQFLDVSYTREKYIKASGINISSNGMLCELESIVEPYSKIYILLDLKDKKDPIEIEGIIIRIEKSGKRYRAGVEFSELYSEDKTRLKKFIKSL
jgi:c-di-GMP-binding flagellar brake protein YcgR